MKNLLLILSAVFSFSLGYGGAPETVEMLSSKVILESKEGYYVLSNGACLKVVGFSTRWRTPSEWWNNVELVPKNYECVPDDWFLGSEIEVYAKYENLEVNLENATNAEILTQCTHLLYNTRTGQVLFAIWMHPAECLVQIFDDAHKDGYDKGYKEGYDKGYKGGYKIGYEDGYQAAL